MCDLHNIIVKYFGMRMGCLPVEILLTTANLKFLENLLGKFRHKIEINKMT